MTHDYWIGDRVWIASLKCEGVFEGEEGEKAIVRIRSTKKLVYFSDISLLPETDEMEDLEEILLTESADRKNSSHPDSIDLHLNALNPNLTYSDPSVVLAHQKLRLRDFIERCIDLRISPFTIIHGKGEGVLRSEVLSVLNEFPEVLDVQEESHGGAVLVRLK